MTDDNTQTLLDAGAAQSGPVSAPTTLAYAVVPESYSIESLESYLPAPARKKGERRFNDTASFIAYVIDQAGAMDVGDEDPPAPTAQETITKLYGCYNPPHFLAVFNDHANHEGGAGWQDHTALYACPLSIEWKTWTGMNKQQMTQEKFAQFIEDNAPDCVSPDAATMIEIARTLEAKKKVNFASGIRLSNGESELTYEESIEGTAGKGKFKLPETFAIGISVLEGGTRYQVHARLRYRIGEQGKLAIWYDLDRPHKVLEDAVKDVWTTIQTQVGRPIYNGG